MTKKIAFEKKVGITTIILMAIIIVVGIYTYLSYAKIIDSLSNSSRKNVEIQDVKELMTKVFEAESEVKSYSITKDTLYLANYENFKRDIRDRIADLNDTNKFGDKSQNVDSILVLVNDKIGLMDELLNIQVEQRVKNALDSAYELIKEEAEYENKELESKSKWNVFSKWKKSKDSKVDTQISLIDVDKNLEEIKEHEYEVNEGIIQKELVLILAGNELSELINQKLALLEKLEADRKALHAIKAKSDIRTLNYQILFFCIVLAGLLLLLTIIILNNAKNNNRFRVALKKAKKEAEKLAKTKERFLATVSHEIRTPMNAIAGFTDLIAKGPLTPEQREHISMVQKSTTHLLYLVNDVLDITKLQNGKVKLEEVNFDVRQILDDVVSFARPMAEEKNNDLIIEIKNNVPRTLRGDIHRLQQIIINILSNAIKFTENGTISIEAFPVLVNEDGVCLKIIINDTGIGMTPEQLKRIFVEFEQAEVSTTRNYGGTGLGLAITRRLINLFDGRIDVESELGKGTTVIVELPFKIGVDSEVVNIDNFKKTDASFLRNKRILIADDELFNRKLLFSMLKDKQVLLTEVEDGRMAVQEVKSGQYDVVLMDVRMPEMNGIEATKKIRKINDHSKKDIPIIALTAAVTEEDKENYFHSGMNGFVPKPFKEEQLINALFEVFGNQTPLSGHSSNSYEREISELTEMITTVNFDELKRLSDADHNFYRDMLETFIDGAKEGLEKLKSDFIDEQFNKMADHAHKISAPAKHLGADKLYMILKNIEIRGRRGDFTEFRDLLEICEPEVENVIRLVEAEMTLS
ncbi:MAG: response regulator [Flavobacteriales bacterium]|nr:response regulator [Flavobacteriales bacterium]